MYSIGWAHTVASAVSPTTHPIVTATFAGCKRLLSKPRAPKKPISSTMLERYIEACPNYNTNLDDMRTLFVVLVGYAGFLRIGEILSIQVRHITIEADCMQIFLPKRKNDQFRQGQYVYINRSRQKTCPVAITECLLRNIKDSKNSTNPVVRRIIHTKQGKRFHPHLGISYSRIRDIIKQKFGQFFANPRDLGTHSLRSGGISDPGLAHVPEKSLQRHGGWKLAHSKDKYIEPTKDVLLMPTRNFSI